MLQRLAIVAGGTRGIGLSVAETFATRGHDLILGYITDDVQASYVCQTLTSRYDVSVTCVKGDIALCETRRRFFDHVPDEAKLNAVVHCAGRHDPIDVVFGDTALAKDKQAFQLMRYQQRVYGEAFVDLCELALHRMQKNRVPGGSIVGLSSPERLDVACVGHSVMQCAARRYALQGASRRVNCNVIVPGVTRTDTWKRVAKRRDQPVKDILELAASTSPMGPMHPRHVAEVVDFLCSTRGRWINGVTIPVDGGHFLV